MQPRAFLRPIVPLAAEDRERAFDEDTFDFIGYLSRRFGVDHELTLEVVGHWLLHYEPVEAPLTTKNSSLLEAERPALKRAAPVSGVFPAVTPNSLERTGT